MINQDKWINSLPKTNNRFEVEASKLDHDRWINTISKENNYNSLKKYSLVAILFVSGLLIVSVIKNETRNLQKEVNNLQKTNYEIRFNLAQAILDNEVITSPENISKLAKENLNIDFVHYKKSQIKGLNDKGENFNKINNETSKKENKNLVIKVKKQVAQKIEEKKSDIGKLKLLYSNPKSIPQEVKKQVVKKVEQKKS